MGQVIIKELLKGKKGSASVGVYKAQQRQIQSGMMIYRGQEIGDNRPTHWHVMFAFKNAVEVWKFSKNRSD